MCVYIIGSRFSSNLHRLNNNTKVYKVLFYVCVNNGGVCVCEHVAGRFSYLTSWASHDSSLVKRILLTLWSKNYTISPILHFIV